MHINIKENIRLSLESIRANKLRTSLTILIIAFGIMALVGILTSIDAIKNTFSDNMSSMGANSFSIKNKTRNIVINGKRSKGKQNRVLKWKEVSQFKHDYGVDAHVAISIWGTGTATLKYASERTHPNVGVRGVDEDYIYTTGEEIEQGRNFSPFDIQNGTHTVILGHQVSTTLFKHKENPLGKIVNIGGGKYKVIGVLKEKGSSFGFSGDRSVWVPVNNVRQYFARPNMNYKIHVKPAPSTNIDAAVGEAIGLFRRLRRDALSDDNSFEIERSDKLEEMALSEVSNISYAATFIGLITILGSAIGLMNIMLVSVTERTREIGIRKALGATAKVIKTQFLIEALVISQLGGLLGIVLGIMIGNSVSLMIGSAFIVPWNWILMGVALCVVVALLSGILPARKAAALDPIDSLRYE